MKEARIKRIKGQIVEEGFLFSADSLYLSLFLSPRIEPSYIP